MTRRTLVGLGSIAVAVIVGFTSPRVAGQGAAPGGAQMPIFEVAPGWLKMPNNWVLGVVSAVAVDRHDNVWILHRPGDVPEDQKANSAPSVLEFDASGKFLQAWGWPQNPAQLWPKRAHCLWIDQRDNVWIGGTWREADESDDYLLKFDSKGKLLLQIGKPTASKSPRDTDNVHGVADLFVDPDTSEVFAADEGNLRVIVYDGETGAFKRMWSGSGDEPPEKFQLIGSLNLRAPAAAAPPARGGPTPRYWTSVHAVRASKDGLVYVADRSSRRIQVFTRDGMYLRQVSDVYAGGLAFSTDSDQRFMYLADSTGRGVEQIVVMDRKTLTVLGHFGKEGAAPGEFRGPHMIGVDSKNDLYIAEVAPGNRLQKFLFKGLGPARAGTPLNGPGLPVGILHAFRRRDVMMQTLMWKRPLTSMLAAAALLLPATTAHAGLVIDLRTAAGGKTATVARVNDTVTINVYGIIQGSDGKDDETLTNVYLKLASTNAQGANSGDIKGNLSTMTLNPPFNGRGSQVGTVTDPDGDGDSDIGLLENDTFVMFRSDSPAGGSAGKRVTFNGNADSTELFLGSFTFTVTSLGSGPNAATVVTPIKPSTGISAPCLYTQDGTNGFSVNYTVGTGVTIKR